MINVTVNGLSEIRERMARFPERLEVNMQEGMKDTLLVMNENIPGYPAPPNNSSYRRTETLGRTLGSSFTGGKEGTPEIYTVTKIGHSWEGRFGTKLPYAPYVIGDNSQAKVHRGRWWVLSEVAERAAPKIQEVWQAIADAMANFLEGK